jgi:chromosome segregation ATPase
LRSQLETEKIRGEEIWEELSDTEQALAEVRSENSELKKTCADLRSQLETERADREEPENSEFLKEENKSLKRLLEKKSPLALSDFYVELQKLRERDRSNRLKTGEEHRATIVQIAELKREIGELQSELADLKQKSAAASKDLPEAADVLNQLKTRRKKSKADLADLEIILEILES